MALSDRQMLLLDTFMYTDLTDTYPNMSLGAIVEKFVGPDGNISMEIVKAEFGSRARSLSGGMEKDLPGVLHILEEIRKDKKLCELAVKYPSRRKYGGIRAACFVEPSGEVTVAFRGTGGSSEQWNNNTEGYGDISQKSQEDAAEYIRSIPYDHVEVTGHSNGGNQAMYVAIVCGYKVTRCVSFEGQGFSKEFIEAYRKQIDRYSVNITNISGSKDFVNVQLISIAGNTYYVMSDSCLGSHSDIENTSIRKEDMTENEKAEDALFNHGSYGILTYADRNGSFDENGNFKSDAHVPQDETCRNIHNFTEAMAKLSDDPLVGEKLELFTDLVGIFLGVFMSSPGVIDEHTMDNIIITIEKIDQWLEQWLVNKTLGKVKDVVEWGHKALYSINDLYCKLADWYNRTSGRLENMVANAGTVLNLDTSRLVRYADEIAYLNGRLDSIDREMDRLYFHLKLWDAFRVLTADVTTHYSLKLKACSDYMSEVASDFEAVESNIISRM